MEIVNLDNVLITDVVWFVIAIGLSYGLQVARRWMNTRLAEGNLSRVEQLAVEAVRYAEILDAQGRIMELGLTKKTAAANALQERLKRFGIKADLTELDQAIELAWYKEFNVSKPANTDTN